MIVTCTMADAVAASLPCRLRRQHQNHYSQLQLAHKTSVKLHSMRHGRVLACNCGHADIHPKHYPEATLHYKTQKIHRTKWA